VALIAGAIWLAERWRTARQPPQAQITSLAVLPLVNQTGDAAQSFFVDGMTDELTTSLAQLNNLKVISETSAMHYRGTTKSLPQIARELGVDGIVEGAVTRSGDEVRVTAQLISARDDRHLWAESFSRSGTNTLGLQHDIAYAIANQIHLTLAPASARRLETLPTHDPAAYDAFLRARYLAKTSLRVEADNRRSIAAAEEAVALDLGFAEAYVAVARGYSDKVFSWSGGTDDDAKAFAAIEKAIALNPNLADAYLVRGMLYYSHLHGFDLVNAIANDKMALSLNPNLADAHRYLATGLSHAGLHDRAVAEFKLALELDPLNDPAKYMLTRALWQSGKFTEAINNTDHYNINCIEGPLPRLYLGRRPQAWALVRELEPQIGGSFRADVDFPAVRALLYAADGKARDADREIQEAVRLGKTTDHFHHTAFIIAASYAEMGRPHEAVQWLRRTVELGMPNYPLFHDNPSMKKLAGNPEYEQFMADFKPRWDQFAASL
jgi:TolB-like protein/Tfp pilus assembly protein PilF